tara:strand:- start:1399 stop:1665 length:267 start_codon:yes stop_codon:yes gene_type:complete
MIDTLVGIRNILVPSVLLLAMCTAAGLRTNGQPAGPFNRGIIAAAANMCPAASPPRGHHTVADAARTLDRWAYFAFRQAAFNEDRCDG